MNDLPDEERNAFLGVLSMLGVRLIDNYLQMKLPGFETWRDALAAEFRERGIDSPQALWKFIAEDPIKNPLDLLRATLSRPGALLGLVKSATAVVFCTYIMQAVTALLAPLITMVLPVIQIVVAVAAVLLILKIAVDFIKEYWTELTEFAAMAAEAVQAKIAEFAASMKMAISAAVNGLLASVIYAAEDICERFYTLTSELKDVLHTLGALTFRTIQQMIQLTSPLLYTLLRSVTGCAPSPVEIDMNRLQNAVDQMARLANSVQQLDGTLSTLYGKLCVSNIEQGEGILTSLANMYHLSRADINVDEGNRIRGKANALSELFREYRRLKDGA